jgi:hypothetical protein
VGVIEHGVIAEHGRYFAGLALGSFFHSIVRRAVDSCVYGFLVYFDFILSAEQGCAQKGCG